MTAATVRPIHPVDPTEFENPFVGGVPISVLDSEAIFLSRLLLCPAEFDQLTQMLEPEHFYATANRRVFEAVRAVRAEAETHDVVLVANWMRTHGTLKTVGGSPYLATLCDAQPAVLNVGLHVAEIREAWRQRELMMCMARQATLLRNGQASHADCYGELREHFRRVGK